MAEAGHSQRHREDAWTMGERTFTSRLLVGTGKYRDFEETRDAI